MEETNIKDFEKYVGRYFFWADDWNAEYEAVYVKSLDVENEVLSVEKFHATENYLGYSKDDIIAPFEQEGYFENIDVQEVTEEEYWDLIKEHTESCYEVFKDLK